MLTSAFPCAILYLQVVKDFRIDWAKTQACRTRKGYVLMTMKEYVIKQALKCYKWQSEKNIVSVQETQFGTIEVIFKDGDIFRYWGNM